MSTGYANRVTHLDFSHKLAAPQLDAAGQPVPELDPTTGHPKVDDKGRPVYVPSERIWVSMRNPALMTLDELTPKAVPLDENGQPVTALSANEAMYEIFAKLILGWRAYDATSFEIDPATGEALPQPLLEMPATVEQIRKLPKAIVDKIADQMMGGQPKRLNGGPGTPYFEDVLLPVESFYEGTWASGALPDEFIEFILMTEMSCGELQETPIYVRQYVLDFLNARNEARNRS